MPKKHSLVLLIDMDAVAADILGSWLPLINKDFGESWTRHNIPQWNIHHCSEGGYKVFDYLHQKGFFYNLKPMPGCVSTLKKLHEEGFEIYYVTAPIMDSIYVFMEKVQWAKKYTPFIPVENIIFTHQKQLVKGDILLDDSPKNLESFPGTAVAFDYLYNRHIKVPRVKNWREFYQLVHKLNDKK